MTEPITDQTRAGLAQLFVSRPILGIVLNLLVVIAGLAALMGVDVREMPDVDQLVISVSTDYDGAVSSIVDQEVTQPLEDALRGLDGLDNMSSSSSAGSSRITIDLIDGTDIDIAANEAREIVSQTAGQLPDDVDDPVVSKNDTNSDPIIRMALLGNATIAEMTEFAEGPLYARLSEVEGVAEVTVRGAQNYEFRIDVAMPSLLARGLTLEDVSEALESLRDDTPLGELESGAQSISLRPENPEVSVETIEQVPVNGTTHISDIATVQFVPEDRDTAARVNGETSVGIEITRQSVGNTLAISRAADTALADLRPNLPDDMELVLTSDDGTYIEASISEVVRSIFLSTLIVVLVVFLFLQSIRATMIPAITIPVALVGTLAAIWLAGFSINTISLLALVLATGMVVDDAIVVTENVVRKRKEGMGPLSAAVTGTNEVFFAVISTTATLAAVFVP
ncbi:MAG: efflux RND transporter permease subunit, partial [Pseudomonadota bacterium]